METNSFATRIPRLNPGSQAGIGSPSRTRTYNRLVNRPKGSDVSRQSRMTASLRGEQGFKMNALAIPSRLARFGAGRLLRSGWPHWRREIEDTPGPTTGAEASCTGRSALAKHAPPELA